MLEETMTEITIRDKDERKLALTTTHFLDPTKHFDTYSTPNTLVGKHQRIKEYDKAKAARTWKSEGKHGLVINPVTIESIVVDGDTAHLHFDPVYWYGRWKQGLEATFNAANSAWLQGEAGIETVTLGSIPSWMAPYASQKAYAKMGSPDVVDMGQALGELHETLTFLRNPLKGLIQHANKHQKAISKRLKKRRTTRNNWGLDAKAKTTMTADVIAESHLSYLYGYQPLMNDLDGITTLATQQKEAINRKIRSAGGVVEHDDPDWTASGAGTISGTSLSGYWHVKRKHHYKVSSKIYYRYKPWMHDAIFLSKLGLSPTQWITTAWAVTPLSFVVDWGLDVSTWLKSLEPKPQLEMLGGCTSSKTTRTSICTLYNTYYPTTGVYKSDGLPTGTCIREKLVRSTLAPPSFTPVWTREFESFNKILASLSLSWALRPKILRRGLVYQDFGL
jgi:hypothetical protein